MGVLSDRCVYPEAVQHELREHDCRKCFFRTGDCAPSRQEPETEQRWPKVGDVCKIGDDLIAAVIKWDSVKRKYTFRKLQRPGDTPSFDVRIDPSVQRWVDNDLLTYLDGMALCGHCGGDGCELCCNTGQGHTHRTGVGSHHVQAGEAVRRGSTHNQKDHHT